MSNNKLMTIVFGFCDIYAYVCPIRAGIIIK